MNSVLGGQVQARRPSDDNMIPLINIVFLLLIFFMVAGQIRSQVPGIRPPSAEGDTKALDVHLMLSVDRDRQIFINALPINFDELPARIKTASEISLFLDRELSAGQLDTVLAILRENSKAKLNLLIEGAGDGDVLTSQLPSPDITASLKE